MATPRGVGCGVRVMEGVAVVLGVCVDVTDRVGVAERDVLADELAEGEAPVDSVLLAVFVADTDAVGDDVREVVEVGDGWMGHRAADGTVTTMPVPHAARSVEQLPGFDGNVTCAGVTGRPPTESDEGKLSGEPHFHCGCHGGESRKGAGVARCAGTKAVTSTVLGATTHNVGRPIEAGFAIRVNDAGRDDPVDSVRRQLHQEAHAGECEASSPIR